MRSDRLETQPLIMGATKANLGHLEAGAGVAGLIKTVMVLQHETATPNPELKSLNPKIAAVIEGFPVRFPTRLEPLRQYSGKIRGEALMAGVSSFGAYGTIAHAVISQAQTKIAREPRSLTPPLERGEAPLLTTTLEQHISQATAVASALDQVFPNRKAFPWQTPPHPLIQQTQVIEDDNVIRHKAVFHGTLMDLFRDHTIQGRCLFPGAGFVEMAFATAVLYGYTK